MERLKVYKVKRGYSNFLVVFGSIFLIIGLWLIIKSVIQKTNLEWNSITFSLQGIIFIIMGYMNLRSEKYFIEWDDTQVKYLLPNTNRIERINFSEIMKRKNRFIWNPFRPWRIRKDYKHRKFTIRTHKILKTQIQRDTGDYWKRKPNTSMKKILVPTMPSIHSRFRLYCVL